MGKKSFILITWTSFGANVFMNISWDFNQTWKTNKKTLYFVCIYAKWYHSGDSCLCEILYLCYGRGNKKLVLFIPNIHKIRKIVAIQVLGTIWIYLRTSWWHLLIISICPHHRDRDVRKGAYFLKHSKIKWQIRASVTRSVKHFWKVGIFFICICFCKNIRMRLQVKKRSFDINGDKGATIQISHVIC